jgi:hypothetical protein
MLWIWIGISRDKEEGKVRCKNADVRKTTARAKTAAESKVRSGPDPKNIHYHKKCLHIFAITYPVIFDFLVTIYGATWYHSYIKYI